MKKGVTLIEVLTTSIIVSIVLTFVGTTLVLSGEIMQDSINEATAQSNLRRIMNQIADDVREGRELTGTSNSLQIKNGSNIINYSISDGKLIRDGIELIIIGAVNSTISGTFTNYTPSQPDMSGLIGKYCSLNYSMTLNITDSKGNIFTSGNLSTFANCRNLP